MVLYYELLIKIIQECLNWIYAEAKKSMSDAEFRQEYEADFNTYEGQIWNFDHEKCVSLIMKFLNTHQMDVFAGLDVGYRDPTAFCVIAYDWDEAKILLTR
jgi:hypothetical protein